MRCIVVITGPTAAGKTEVALALAERANVALISVDSAQVYRGMDIGTAKPPPDVLDMYPHALVNIRDPAQAYTAADFVADADAAVEAAFAQGRLPVLVGGTMLYLKAFRDGLAELPPPDPQVRADVVADADARGWPALYRELAAVDPAAAARIDAGNRQRIARALEVYRLTGQPISTLWAKSPGRSVMERLRARMVEFAVADIDRGVLHARIEERLTHMLDTGFIDEVRRLRARGDLTPELPSMRAVGYRQVWAFLADEYDRAELRARATAATRQLAKKQYTWLRRWTHVRSLPAGATGDAVVTIAAAADLALSGSARHS